MYQFTIFEESWNVYSVKALYVELEDGFFFFYDGDGNTLLVVNAKAVIRIKSELIS